MDEGLAICCVCTRNTLKEFRFLKYSMEQYHPSCRWLIAADPYVAKSVTDRNVTCLEIVQQEGCHWSENEIQMAHFQNMILSKIYLLDHATRQFGYGLLLDTDMFFLSSLKEDFFSMLADIRENSLDCAASNHNMGESWVGRWNTGMILVGNRPDFLCEWRALTETVKYFYEQKPFEMAVDRLKLRYREFPFYYNFATWRVENTPSKEEQYGPSGLWSNIKIQNGQICAFGHPLVNVHIHLFPCYRKDYIQSQVLADAILEFLKNTKNPKYRELFQYYTAMGDGGHFGLSQDPEKILSYGFTVETFAWLKLFYRAGCHEGCIQAIEKHFDHLDKGQLLKLLGELTRISPSRPLHNFLKNRMDAFRSWEKDHLARQRTRATLKSIQIDRRRNVVEVPETFREITHKWMPSPPHQEGLLIEQYFDRFFRENNVRLKTCRVYLPIFWTNYYVNRDHRSSEELLDFLQTLDPNEKYFTVIQHDQGIIEDFPAKKNLLVFSSGGIGDIPIPLLCDPHPYIQSRKDLFASFIGNLHTHRCRQDMKAACRREDIQIIHAEGFKDIKTFETLMARSTFSLCPRGWGKTSWRLYESIQMKSIPVYIFDQGWFPFANKIDWDDFCVRIHAHDIEKLEEILERIPNRQIDAMRQCCEAVYQHYFNFEACCRHIIDILNSEA